LKKLIAAGLCGILASITVSGCTDTTKAEYGSYGKSARVVCFSGEKKIFDDFSTGKISSEDSGSGYKFVAKSTRRLIHVSGACSFDYDAAQPAGFKPIHPEDAA
jgi:hypothetical protein